MSTTKAQRAAKALAALEQASQAEQATFRGTFALIPATATEWVCVGAGHGEGTEALPLKSFPTTARHGGLEATQRRTGECRACRNSRQGRAEKAAAKVEAAAKAKAKAKAAQAAKATARKASRAAKVSTAKASTVEATAAA